jgi:hypothetical protein
MRMALFYNVACIGTPLQSIAHQTSTEWLGEYTKHRGDDTSFPS